MRKTRVFVCTAILALAGALSTSGTAMAGNSSGGQLVFSSAGGFGTFAHTPTPFGFWIWCQSQSSTNAYGNDCAGSMYFYALNPSTEQVAGSVTGSGSSGYTLTVSNTTGSFPIACTLTNTPPPTNGPTNTVTLDCSDPGGSGVVTNAVVSGSGTFKS